MFLQKQKFNSNRLQHLIDSAYSSQWSPNTAINWKQKIIIPKLINAKTYIDMVSQLYYAEEATIQILGKLITIIPDLQARQYLCTQAMEEARHSQVYRRYLEKMGDIAPINEGLRNVLESGIHWQGSFCGTVIALNVVMEGEAVNQQRKRIQTLPCPLFRNINEMIIRDEYRHAAFGRIYMREKLTDLSNDERFEILSWIKNLWKLWACANNGRYTVDGSEILQTEKQELSDRWQQQQKIFINIGLC